MHYETQRGETLRAVNHYMNFVNSVCYVTRGSRRHSWGVAPTTKLAPGPGTVTKTDNGPFMVLGQYGPVAGLDLAIIIEMQKADLFSFAMMRILITD